MFFDWTGRDDRRADSKRIHQIVKNIKKEKINKVEKQAFGIVGFACDEGVRRNQGRLGAAKGPNQIRQMMGSIPYDANTNNLIDIGNVYCKGHNLEKAQKSLGEHVSHLIEHNYTPIILGGGHETFYGHYLGARQAIGSNKKIGLINLDAHLDMRLDDQTSSGTMFRQILETDDQAEYLCLGLQELGNTEQLFNTAKKHDVTYILETDLEPLEKTLVMIDKFSQQQDVIIYTICSDVINQAYAPGVSAPAPFGLHPNIVRAITRHIVTQSNFLSFDISEVNPVVDRDDQTSRLAGYIVSEVIATLNQAKL